MPPRFFFWTLGLVAVLLTVSCASSITSAPAAPLLVSPVTATPANLSAPTSTAAVQVQVIATSRGPNLEATDPSTVNLASGKVQFVEFFRFS